MSQFISILAGVEYAQEVYSFSRKKHFVLLSGGSSANSGVAEKIARNHDEVKQKVVCSDAKVF